MDKIFEAIQEKQRYQVLLLLALVALATALRVFMIGEWSFWGDEWITVERASSLSLAEFDFRSLSLLATRLSFEIWGASEMSARLPAAIIGILSIPVLYFVTKRMFDPIVALLASLLLAVSQWHLYWSQNARFYTALLLFFTIALFFFYYGLEKDRPLYLILSLFFLGLALKERDVAAFLGPITFAYVLLLVVLRYPKPAGFRWRNLLLYFGPGLVGGLWIAYQNLVLRGDRWERAFSVINNNPLWILAGVVFYVGLPLTCFTIAGAILLLRRKDRAGLLLTLASSVPLLSIMALALVQYTANRYVFISLTSMAILASVAAKELLQESQKSYAIVALGALAILVLQPMSDNLLYYRYQHGNRDNWKAAFELVRERAQEGDRVVTINRDLADYYMHGDTSSMRWGGVDEMVGDEERVWFVVDMTTPTKEREKYRWIVRNARHVAAFDVTVAGRTFPMRVYLYEAASTIPVEVWAEGN